MFPEIERDLRERVDYGIGFVENSGAILQRAEAEASTLIAVDGHAGTILRTLREHQMSADAAFLKRVWPKVKKAVEWLVTQDGDEDGVISGAQLHTLDQPWFGHISWISSLYAAALKAGAVMAREMNDDASAARWEKIAGMASQRISEDLWHKKQFFIQKAPPDKLNELGAGYGCHIDQVYGQSWAWQVGLPRVLPEDQTRKALESLWKYNFTPDVGPFREGSPIPGGRWYAMPGEGGLVMCTFPDPEHSRPTGDGFHAFYFNECMSGFEYQVAAHMIWEGGDLLEKGLAIARMIHDHPPQSVERSRVRRPLRPRAGQLWRLHRGMRIRIRRAETTSRFRPAAHTGGFQGTVHQRRRLGDVQPENHRRHNGSKTRREAW